MQELGEDAFARARLVHPLLSQPTVGEARIAKAGGVDDGRLLVCARWRRLSPRYPAVPRGSVGPRPPRTRRRLGQRLGTGVHQAFLPAGLRWRQISGHRCPHMLRARSRSETQVTTKLSAPQPLRGWVALVVADELVKPGIRRRLFDPPGKHSRVNVLQAGGRRLVELGHHDVAVGEGRYDWITGALSANVFTWMSPPSQRLPGERNRA